MMKSVSVSSSETESIQLQYFSVVTNVNFGTVILCSLNYFASSAAGTNTQFKNTKSWKKTD